MRRTFAALGVIASFTFTSCSKGGAGAAGPDPAARSGAPAAGLPFDVGSVVRQVQRTFRVDEDGWRGGQAAYAVKVDARGALEVTPRSPLGGASGAVVRLETVAVERGGAPLVTGGGTVQLAPGGALATARGEVVETLAVRDEGVEQSWSFSWKPEGAGDLAVRVSVDGLEYAGETEGGLHFRDPATGLGVRYGRAVWIDGAGVHVELAPRLEAGEVVVRVPEAVVEAAAYPAVLDPIIGPEQGIDTPVAVDATAQSPRVAYDAASQQYLVVWSDNRGAQSAGATGAFDVYGARVAAATGAILDATGIPISTAAGDQLAPTVAAGGGGFLVAWTDYRGAPASAVYGARVVGGAVQDPNGILLSLLASGPSAPSAAFDGTNWVVAFQATGAGSDVFAARVSTAGAVVGNALLTVSAAAGDQTGPAVASNGAGTTLVTWTDGRNGANTDVYAARISANGTVQDPNGILVTSGTATSSQRTPAAAWDGTDFFVAWSDNRGGTWDVYAVRVRTNGTVRGTQTVVSAAAGDQTAPAAASFAANGGVTFVAWSDTRSGTADVWGARVAASGNTLNVGTAVLVNGGAGAQVRPAVAADGSNYLVAWEDGGRATYPTVAGVRVSNAAPPGLPALLDASALAIAQPHAGYSSSESAPAVAWNGSDWLVVWTDANRGASADVWGARVAPGGAIRDPGGIPVCTAAGDQTAPAVACAGGPCLVAWTDLRSGTADVYGTRVSAAGAVLDGTGLAISAVAGAQGGPAVGASGADFLVAWTDQRGGSPETWAARVTGAGGLPDAGGFRVGGAPSGVAVGGSADGWLVAFGQGAAGLSAARVTAAGQAQAPVSLAAAGAASAPAVASGAADWLVAWQSTDGAGRTRVVATRVAAAGTPRDAGLGFGAAAADQTAPAAAWDGTTWLVAWQDRALGGVAGARVSTVGAVLDPAPVGLAPGLAAQFEPELAGGPASRLLLVHGAPDSSAGVNATRIRALEVTTWASLAVARAGGGTGTVTSSPAGVDCGAACSASFDAGSTVTLTAAPGPYATFAGWSGDCAGAGPTTTVVVDRARSCTATFGAVSLDLSVVRSGTGSGVVNASPGPIACGPTCTGAYAGGSAVTLTAAADGGSSFGGWSGGGCSGTGACTVTVTAATTVTARFDRNTQLLSVTRSGAGTGTVTATPGPVDCGATCSGAYDQGSAVTLAAVAGAGARFGGWSGACSGAAGCALVMDAARAVDARFDRVFPLSVTRAGAGAGDVVADAGELACGAVCAADYLAGAVVTLTAAAQPGSAFGGWSGACSGTGACVVTLDAARAVTATFVPTYPLTLQLDGTGAGEIGCPLPSASCAADYPAGTVVSLVAIAAPGSTFAGWSGACAGTGGCAVLLDAARAVTARFERVPPSYVLTVQRLGAGDGAVGADLGAIACGAVCADAYVAGTVVTLVAAPTPGSVFDGWSGACAGQGACVVTVDAPRTAIATFVPASPPPELVTLTVARAGAGSGSVASGDGAISCGTACAAGYAAGTPVTLTASPAAGSAFAGWSGACTGAGACAVTMDQARAVTATFLPLYHLSVSTAGGGVGTVTCPGLAACDADLVAGTAVTLQASPAAGSRFAGWSGACAGTGPCALAMDAPRAVTAAFELAPPSWTLTVARAGAGAGTVSSTPAGIACGPTCAASFDDGTVVALRAEAAPGATFAGWSGGGCAGTGACTVALRGATTVTARFEPLAHLAVAVTATGGAGGQVLWTGGRCASGAAGCGGDFAPGTVLALSAVSAAGARFAGWSGDCSGTGACTLVLDGPRTVGAAFAPAPAGEASGWLLLTAAGGTGAGLVTSDDPDLGIACTTQDRLCSASVPRRSSARVVTLTATPSPGSIFAGWAGDGCAGTGTCAVEVSGWRIARAVFVPSELQVLVHLGGTGGGTVDGGPLALACSDGYCVGSQPNAPAPPAVTLTPRPDASSTFEGWSLGCQGTGPCQVALTGHLVAQARFRARSFPLRVGVVGAAPGTVTGAGLACGPGGGAGCTAELDSGAAVTLGARPGVDAAFAGWIGACAGSGPTCALAMDAARSTWAVFAPATWRVDVALLGTGEGAVEAVLDDGAAAEVACTDSSCTVRVPHASPARSVTLTGVAGAGSRFAGWSGGCAGAGPCTLVADRDRSAAATFDPRDWSLDVGVSGSGGGHVGATLGDGSDTGLDCARAGGACAVTVPAGAVVTLAARPDPGSTFTGWSNDCAGAEPECTLAATGPHVVTATFRADVFPLSVGVVGTGAGVVSGDGPASALACAAASGPGCTVEIPNVDPPTVVTLGATPAAGSVFAGWMGACSGMGPCRISMSSAASAWAIFHASGP